MKKIYILFGLAMALVISGCEKSPQDIIDSSGEYVNIADGFSLINYSMQLNVVDAADYRFPVEDATVTVEGYDADLIFESGGSREFKLTRGQLQLVVNPSFEPEEGNPLNFTVIINAPGYLPVRKEFRMFNTDKEKFVTLPMVNISNPPSGAAVATEQFSLTGGELTTTEIITVNASGDKVMGGSITIPAGTKFYDVNGNQLTGGTLDVQMIHFDGTNDACIAVMPGGGIYKDLISTPDGVFAGKVFPVSFADVQMFVSGTKVKTFNNPIEIATEIAPDAININTQTTFMVGDELTLSSYDEEKPYLSVEETLVVEEVNGTLMAIGHTSHLTHFEIEIIDGSVFIAVWDGAIDLLGGSGLPLSENCNKVINFTVPGTGTSERTFYMEFVEEQYGLKNVYTSGPKTVYNGSSVSYHYYGYPNESDYELHIYEGVDQTHKGNLLYTFDLDSGCDTNNTVTLDASLFSSDIIFKGSASCANGTVEKPSFYLYQKPAGASLWEYIYIGHVEDGQLTINSDITQDGQTYDYWTLYNNKIYETTYTVDYSEANQLDFPLDANTCMSLFGS
ncbi:hypothetical protein [Neptunitalea lumnitzerae]|uniref:Calx-beta domain-containing protein n=1 Tax=Neptunitalea lumnitzerae TaxID=2965509 RepID=A0ABQ5MMX1_9FLAO|nr:hypothetical protein [Neptunitalea sp. Y10]GLB50740.1 hypothetical protein Y10_31080 [Neptunitalea sp. Y10]